jgi:hypothetical protein
MGKLAFFARNHSNTRSIRSQTGLHGDIPDLARFVASSDFLILGNCP